MASSAESNDVRRQLVELLLSKVEGDRYPSVTMMNLVEELMTPDEVPVYAQVLMDKIRADRFPSVSMMLRVRELG
jgi:hypothetical protein